MKKVLGLLLFAFINLSAQQYILKGTVENKITGEQLNFASIRIEGTSNGTTTNGEGNYEFRLKPGVYRLIASYIGFVSDTLKINLQKNIVHNFKLDPKGVNIAEITVLPEDNPANEVIRRAIIVKNERKKYLNDYSFNAYTKGLVKTTKDFSVKGNTASAPLGTKDTSQLKITGIIENESRGYFKKPKYYKDEIIARKQSANTPSQINIFTGGRVIQDFYRDDIRFMGRPLPGPISDDALDFYYFKIIDTVSIDRINVFRIHFSPRRESDPGFEGDVFIADNIFALVKIDVSLTKAANYAGIFKKTRIFQQFYAYADDIYMPVDYRIFVEGNALGMFKFGFELNTLFSNYQINKNIPDEFFGMAIIKVLPDADKKDSTYWRNIQALPNTPAEMSAYKRIDSLEVVPVTFADRFSFLSSSIDLSDHFTVTGPVGLYDFNKVEGHALKFDVSGSQLLEERFGTSLNLRYGFNDKKFKTEFSANYLLGEYRTARFSLSLFNKVNPLFASSDRYSDFTSTFMNLFLKEDFREYYYSKGFRINYSTDVLPVLRLGIGFANRTDNTAINNTNFSIFRKGWNFNPNYPVYDTKVNALVLSFNVDYRKYIEDGYRRMRVSDSDFNLYLNGSAFISDKNMFGSNDDFKIYGLNLSGNFRVYKTVFLGYYLGGNWSQDAVPFQYLNTLPGNINSVSKDYSFRTLRVMESFGDRVVTSHLTLNFGDEFFRILNVPLLRDWQLLFSMHLNAGWIDLANPGKVPAGIKNNLYTQPLVEAGFGIGQMLLPFRIEFTWRLTQWNGNGFAISLNSNMLF
jgi:hypothetical protein